MSDTFSPTGALATGLPGYEYRPQQRQMAGHVADALTGGGVTIIEAGTGTGKSLAYVIPAAQFALQAEQPVVISTNTINLQEQLINKDIPWVQANIAPDLRAVLVKGWGNYLCLHRYEQVVNDSMDLLDSGEETDLAIVRRWIAAGPGDGSKGALSHNVEDNFWGKIAAESDTCLRKKCPFIDHCYVFKARRAMAGAHLLVVNHHLLFADISIRQTLGWETDAVLPVYRHVIIDEAHHIEDVATEHFGGRFTQIGWRQSIGRMMRIGRGGKRQGHLAAVLTRIGKTGQLTDVAQTIERTIAPCIQRALETGDSFFAAVGEWIQGQRSGNDRDNVWPLQPDDVWRANVAPPADKLARVMHRISRLLRDAAADMREAGDDWEATAQETEALGLRMAGQGEALAQLVAADDDDHVYWITARAGARQQRPRIDLHSAPITIGPAFVRLTTEQLHSTVLCSATLSVDNSFDYTLARLGFRHMDVAPQPARLQVKTAHIASPFDFDRQVKLFVPQDMAEPGDGTYDQELARRLIALLQASRGRAFVLFTSYMQMQRVAAWVGPALAAAEINLWLHGTEPRDALLERFTTTPRSVLFGTDSFWEGVDVRGEALSVVAIARLPFDVPSNPVIKARSDLLRDQGQNPFYDYSVPRAAIKLKQGFGRLIRSASDSGAVVIYDRRLVTKSYGRVLRASLPVSHTHEAHHDEIVRQVAQMLP